MERATVSDVLSGNLINERSIVENVTSNRKIGIKKRFQTKHSEICTARVINNPLELDNDISICWFNICMKNNSIKSNMIVSSDFDFKRRKTTFLHEQRYSTELREKSL